MSNAKESQIQPTHTQPSHSNNPSMGTVTSSFLITMDDIFLGNLKDFDYCGALLYYTSIEQRVSIGAATSDFLSSATLIHSLLELHVMTDSSMPTLRQKMRDNSPITTITIRRIGHLGAGYENTENVFVNFFRSLP